MGSVSYKWGISNLESGAWSRQQGPSINPVAPASFIAQPQVNGLGIYIAGSNYAGALAKNVSALPLQSSQISFMYQFLFDYSIQYAQVIETDMKVTDANGWTYDGSFQWNIAEGWMTQINNPWVDTGLKVSAPLPAFINGQFNNVKIDYLLDYDAHTITVQAVNNYLKNTAPIPAKQVGWDKSQIVTQLQLCTVKQESAYSIVFNNIGYTGSN